MKYLLSNDHCTTCGIGFHKLPFVEYRALGFCTETCWNHISIKTMTKKAIAIQKTYIALDSQKKLNMDFEQRVGAA